MSRRQSHRRSRKGGEQEEGGGFKVGQRSRGEIETVGMDKVTDIESIGPKTTKRLKKRGIVTLKDAERLEDPELIERLEKDKLRKPQLKRLMSAAEAARKAEAAQVLEDRERERERERRIKIQRIGKRKMKTVPKASMMKHQLKEYLTKSAKEHDITAIDDLWDEYSAEISWDKTQYDEAWDIMYQFLKEKGLETEKVQMAEAKRAAETALDQEQMFILDRFEDEYDALKEQEARYYEELKEVSKKDPELAAKIAEGKSHSNNPHPSGTKQKRLTGETVKAGKLPDLPGHIEEKKPGWEPKRPAEFLDTYRPEQKRMAQFSKKKKGGN